MITIELDKKKELNLGEKTIKFSWYKWKNTKFIETN